MVKRKSRTDKILKILRTTYPNVKTQLRHKNPFQLLVATILSAQCTDRQVNAVTPGLFKKLKTPDDFAGASIETIETLIHSTGFYRNKAKNIQNCSKTLLEKFNGKVPDKLEELIQLPGVGRKTANVVLGAAFGVPGIVVDTHVARISKRLGLTKQKDPVKIEFDLMEIIPEASWNAFSLQLIYFGRAICKARKPDCPVCPLYDLCDYPAKVST
ncbi:endonuclease III [Thermodesulfobacteriota bacterium]